MVIAHSGSMIMGGGRQAVGGGGGGVGYGGGLGAAAEEEGETLGRSGTEAETDLSQRFVYPQEPPSNAD